MIRDEIKLNSEEWEVFDKKQIALAIVEVFSDLNTDYNYYCNLHKQDKSCKLNIDDTRKENLEFKIERIGLMRR